MLSCNGYTTYSQGAYGATNGAPSLYMQANFDDVFASGVQIGDLTAGAATDALVGAGERAALFTSAQAIIDLLPVGGPDSPPQGLNTDSVDATSLGAGTLAGHTIAMTLSLGFDAADAGFAAAPGYLGDLTYNAASGITTVLNGLTVTAIVAEANAFLSGAATTHSGGELTEALRLIIQEFDNGIQDTTNELDLDCDDVCDDPIQTTVEIFNGGAISGQKWEDHDGNGIQDVGDDGIPNWNITLTLDVDGDGFDADDDQVIGTTPTDGSGNYSFTGLAAGSYRVEEETVAGWTHTTDTFHDVTLTASVVTTVEELNTDADDCIDEILTTITTTVSSSDGNSFGNFENIAICGVKYQDHNGNGTQDANDQVLSGWTFILNDDGDGIANNGEVIAVTGNDGVFCFSDIGPGAWNVTEAFRALNWVPTQGDDGYSGSAMSGEDVNDLTFGNVDVGKENGKTLGFWSNKNGQALITSSDIAALNALNLKTASGADAAFTNAASVKSFLLAGTATNMANMLSVQLAATVLNVLHANFGSSTSIYIDGTLTSWSGNGQGANLAANLDHDGDSDNADADGLVNEYGFADINALIAAANAELAAHSVVLSGSAFRDYQEALKIAFDGMNNNLAIFAL